MDVHYNIRFENLSYSCDGIRIPFKRKDRKKILNGISGEFCGSELTAVIGLSGSGKTSLLDCLSGFRRDNVNGAIMLNESEISTKSIKQISSYVMQEQTLHVLLTINEILKLSLNLRNGHRLNSDQKEQKIKIVLEKLNITNRCDTLIRDLSGGERKRLQIAIELMDDPKILFLDEPTTNLDSVASLECIRLLKNLASENRTIICTIHQPSALMFDMFDNIYALANGSCIYQGSSQNLIRFFGELELPCPSTYNPADYLLEIANNDYGEFNEQLIEKIRNGANFSYRTQALVSNESPSVAFKRVSASQKNSSSYFLQVLNLMIRTFLISSRDKTLIYMRFGLHIILGIAFGVIYKDIGNKGSLILDNYRYCIISVSTLLYTSYHSLYASFPLDFPIIKREHFNGWYSTRAYYTALILFDAPIIFFCCVIYISITYLLTDQPLEFFRYLALLKFCLSMSYAAQALGIMFTSLMDAKMMTTFGTILLMPFFLLSSFIIFEKDTHPSLVYFFNGNFLNMAFKGSVNSILGLDRKKLECDQMYCHYSNPKKLLNDFEMNVDMTRAIFIIIIYFIVCHIMSFFLIRYRLKYKHS